MSNFPNGYHLHTMGWSSHELVAMFIYDYINLWCMMMYITIYIYIWLYIYDYIYMIIFIYDYIYMIIYIYDYIYMIIYIWLYIYDYIYICICIDLSLDITHMLPLYIIIHVTDLEFAQGTPPKNLPYRFPK